MIEPTPPVRIRIRPIGPATHEVVINDVSAGLIATSVEISMRENNIPQVTLTLVADEIDVDIEALLSVYMEPK